MYQLVMVKYGELGLKGKNKMQFVNRLAKNIEKVIADLEPRKVIVNQGRIFVPAEDDMDEVMERLQKVFGIYALCPVVRLERNMDEIKEMAWKVLQDALPNGGKFKVESRRADKRFPLPSPEISREVAGYIFDQCGDEYEAEMRHPKFSLQVEVREDWAYIYCQAIPGAKGMPVGTGGKAVVMLSGGIDSPVAAWMAMKRGVSVEMVHFESFPFTSQRAQEKVLDLAKILTEWSNASIKVHCVHFTEIQKAIHEKCREEYGITIMRRFMFRIAERIATQGHAMAIYTGESVGQVASQTLESMFTINNVTTMPVLRPLVGMDKEEIMALANRIGTYETSIQPYEDCCTVFLPAHPKIKPKLSEAEAMEKYLDVEGLINDAMANINTIKVHKFDE